VNDPSQIPAVQSLEPRQPLKRRGRLVGATVVSAAAHLAIVGAIILARTDVPPLARVDPLQVQLVTWKRPVLARRPEHSQAAPDAPQHVIHQTPPPQKALARRSPAPVTVDSLLATTSDKTSTTESQGELTDADLAGASTAGSGAGGGDCNMARRLEAALRRDNLVQTAVAEASGSSKAIMVWNGDWVQSHSEDGKGLAAVREAIIWEIAFAPPACRAEPMHGLMLISLNDSSGTARLAVGHGQWRWSDLLALHHSG